MSESLDGSRQSIDIADFERRLRETSHGSSHYEDPLAELERLFDEPENGGAHESSASSAEQAGVGRSAPFVDPPQVRPAMPVAPPPFVASDKDQWDDDLRAWENELRGLAPQAGGSKVPPPVDAPVDSGIRPVAPPRGAPIGDDEDSDVRHQEAERSLAELRDDAAFDDDEAPRAFARWDSSRDQASERDFEDDDELDEEESPSFARKSLMWAGVGVVALLVAGGAYALRGRIGAPKAPPTIMASSQPTKIRPENAGGGEADPAVSAFDRRGDAVSGSKVVNNAEAPADLSAQPAGSMAAAVAMAAVPPGQAAAPQAQPAGDPGFFPAPKRVKTVSVRPDGSIIDSDAPAPRPTIPPGAQTPAPAASAPRAAAPATTPAAPPAAKPATPKTTARIVAPAKPDAETTPGSAVAAHAKPMAPPPAAKPPKPASAPASDAAAPASGGFSVQFAATGSDSEAHDRAGKVQGQYAGALGGRKPTVVRGEANGATVYRVRVTGLSKDGAAAMCAHVKESGGNCFVAGN